MTVTPSTHDAVIHLIDDDEGVRQSLIFSLSTAGLAVRAYDSAVAFLKAFPHVQPGCIVTDVRMPEIDGIELQQRLKQLGAKLPVIVMTGHGDVRLAVEAMKAGATDFIEKPFDDEVLLAAIRDAISRHGQLSADLGEAEKIKARFATLTAREHEVLKGLLAGYPNKTIAYDLELSTRTVEVHRANLMKKTAATSFSDLVRMALAAGLD